MTLQYADFPDPQPAANEPQTLPEKTTDVVNEWPELADACLSPYNMDLASAGHVPAWPLE
jgi:hypothetical protein